MVRMFLLAALLAPVLTGGPLSLIQAGIYKASQSGLGSVGFTAANNPNSWNISNFSTIAADLGGKDAGRALVTLDVTAGLYKGTGTRGDTVTLSKTPAGWRVVFSGGPTGEQSLELTVQTPFGIDWGTVARVADPISGLTGELFDDPPPDLTLGGGPFPLELRRHSGSFLAVNGINGSMGTNWLHNFDVHTYISGTLATVATFQGRLVSFLLSGANWSPLEPYPLGYQFASVAGGGFRFLDPADNRIYTFAANGFLTRIEDRNGNALTVTPGATGPTQVSDGLGRTLTFTYTAGRVTQVRDQSGRSVSYTYSGTTLGTNLASFTDAAGKVTTYTTGNAGGVLGVLTRTTLAAGNTSFAQIYDSSGRASSQADGRGNITSIAYSATTLGDATVRDALGNATAVSHADLVDYTGSVDANGQVTSTSYDANHRPISIVDRNGNPSSASYHGPSGYLASFTDAAGNQTTFAYTASTAGGFTFYDRTGVTYPDGTSAAFTYDARGNLLKITDQAGKATTYTYNARGQVLTVTNPAGGVTTLTYNTDGTLASSKTPSGDTTTYTYDTLKRLAQIKYPDAGSAAFTYDTLDRITQVTDPRSKVTQAAYTDNGELSTVTDPLGNTSTLTYDTAENLSSVASPTGTAGLAYNAVNLPSAITAPSGETTSFSYDSLNRVASVSDALGPLAAYTYDREGALTSVTDGANRSFQIVPDALGRPVQLTTPLGAVWTQAFDPLGRPVSAQDPLGAISSFSYDARGLVSGIALPGAVQASFARDDLGDLTSITDPNGRAWTRAYDNRGRLTSTKDPLARTVSLTYDARSRVSSATSPEGTVQFTYDAADNLTRGLYSDKTDLSYTYDDNNRITAAPGVTLAYDAVGGLVKSNGIAIERDSSERITSIAYPPGKVTYRYNNRGLLAQIADWAGATTAFAYDASLRLSSIARANGVVTQYSYDADGNLSGIAETGSSAISTISLQRDAAGRITGADRTQPRQAEPAPGSLGFTYDAAHQLAGATYDGLGRLKGGALRTYTWDLASRLTSYQGADGSASFTYDGFGMRTARTSGGATESYVLNYALSLPSVAVVRAGGSDQTYYIYLPGGTLLYSVDAAGGSRHYYHFDEAGNTLFLTGDDGSVTDAYGILPYGETVSQTGSTKNPFTWQGEFGVMAEGQTSLYYMRARYFDSASARFLSRDPVDSLAPNEIDPYQYALGDPTAIHDPTGLKGNPAPPSVGRSNETYDTATRLFAMCADLTEARIQRHTVHLLKSGDIFCAGGVDSTGGARLDDGTVIICDGDGKTGPCGREVFDPISGTFAKANLDLRPFTTPVFSGSPIVTFPAPTTFRAAANISVTAPLPGGLNFLPQPATPSFLVPYLQQTPTNLPGTSCPPKKARDDMDIILSNLAQKFFNDVYGRTSSRPSGCIGRNPASTSTKTSDTLPHLEGLYY